MKKIVGIVIGCVVLLAGVGYGCLGQKSTTPETVPPPVTQAPQQIQQPAAAPMQMQGQPASQFPQSAPPRIITPPVTDDGQSTEAAPAARPAASPAALREQKMLRNQQRIQRRQGRQ